MLSIGLVAWTLANAARLRAGAVATSDGPVPPAALLRVASWGQAPQAASLLWADTSMRWARDAHMAPDRLQAAVRTVGDLDPHWATPWTYGALMLEAQGDRDAHEQLLLEATERHPTEAVFPYALAMSLLARGDRPAAATWMARAAAVPEAPAIHAAAAEALRARIETP